MIGEPERTPYDLSFRLFEIPVRVHPFFWVMAVILGITGPEVDPVDMLLWIVAVFVSVLVHELGHALTARAYGAQPWITLHGFGGLASYPGRQQSTKSEILITLAGPLAGFAFAGLVLLVIVLSGQQVEFRPRLIPVAFEPYASPPLNSLLSSLLVVNIFWGLINLLPVYPLDGGQIARSVAVELSPYEGIRQSLMLSMGVAIGVAILCAVWVSFFTAFLFGYLAYLNYATLQAYSGRGGGGW